MLQNVTLEDIESLIGSGRLRLWAKLCNAIDSRYDMERLWGSGGKAWRFEYKYRRGGKTLCALYAREDCLGFMIIFGRDERAKFEAVRHTFSEEVQKTYDAATTYHDGKWVMFKIEDSSMFDDVIRLLAIKRKPNRKVLDQRATIPARCFF
jgi:hypothetical protein